MSDQSNLPFAGTRILELGGMVSAAYAAKLFADLGAEVIKVEPPKGDPARQAGPFPGGEANPEASALYLYLNTNKRSVVLGDSKADRAKLRELATAADLILENLGETAMAELGLDWESVSAASTRALLCSITAYGRTGPLADVPGDELTLLHAGGLANLLPTRSRDVDRAPVKLGGYQAAYHGAIAAALASAAALRDRSQPLLIDVSLQDVLLAMVSPVATGTRHLGTTWSRVPDRPPAMGRMETSDGYVILNAFDDHHFGILRELMGNPDWCAGDEWLDMRYRTNHLMDIAPQIEAWMRLQKKADIHQRAGQAGIPIGPINTAAEVLDWEQYAARNYFVAVEHSEAGRQHYPGWPYRMSHSEASVRSAAPRLGELPSDDASFSSSEASGLATPSGDAFQLLRGIRVLEFCWVWAGPYAGSLLGALGADVIRVESHRRMDLMRRSMLWTLPDHRPRMLPANDGIAYNQVNLNKRSLTLDLSQPRGRELAQQLANRSDVVTDNMRPGALDKLGLGYEQLAELHPEIIVASSSGRGRGGPDSEFLGYAMVHQGIGGGAHISGYPDDHPTHSGGDVDLMNAMTLAFSILAAVRHRERTGAGQFIDYSQCEGVTSLLGEVMLGYQLDGVLPERDGNRHACFAPSGVYRCWGVDRWLALEVHDDEEFEKLAAQLGNPELAHDSRFETPSARKQHEEALDELIESYTRERDRDSLVARWRQAGLCAAPSAEALDLYADPHLQARSAFVPIAHPAYGHLELVREPWLLNERDPEPQPAPRLGEHNADILSELLGLDDDEIQNLRESGVICESETDS